MTLNNLEVLIAGKHAGTLFQDESGALSFIYQREYHGVPFMHIQHLSRHKVFIRRQVGLGVA